MPARAPRPNPSDTQSLRMLLDDDYSDEDITNYYAMAEQQALQHGDTKRYGRRVVWVGMEGALIEIDSRYARALDCNVFYPRKLSAIVNAIKSGQRPTLVVGYGDVGVITKLDVEQDQAAFARGELMTDRPLNESDIGQFIYRIRDGNHRVFGAFLAGETTAWMHLSKSRLQDITEYRLAKRARKLAALKEKYNPRYVKNLALIDQKLRTS